MLNRHDAEFCREKILGYYNICIASPDANTPQKAFDKAKNETIKAYERMLIILNECQFEDVFKIDEQ